MRVMDKRILISLPAKLYANIKKAASSHYQTVSGYIRESVVEKIQEELSPEEAAVIRASKNEIRRGKGTPWRKVRRA